VVMAKIQLILHCCGGSYQCQTRSHSMVISTNQVLLCNSFPVLAQMTFNLHVTGKNDLVPYFCLCMFRECRLHLMGGNMHVARMVVGSVYYHQKINPLLFGVLFQPTYEYS